MLSPQKLSFVDRVCCETSCLFLAQYWGFHLTGVGVYSSLSLGQESLWHGGGQCRQGLPAHCHACGSTLYGPSVLGRADLLKHIVGGRLWGMVEALATFEYCHSSV